MRWVSFLQAGNLLSVLPSALPVILPSVLPITGPSIQLRGA